MKLKKQKQTFESISKEIHELRSEIEEKKVQLADNLALLNQYKLDVEVTTRCVNDELGVKPMHRWQAEWNAEMTQAEIDLYV
jgi:DUF4097 and DUF4098 domain-containing protein YvlB